LSWPDEHANLSSFHSPQTQTIKHPEKHARALRVFSHSLIQVVSEITVVMGYKGKRCAAPSGSFDQTVATINVISESYIFFKYIELQLCTYSREWIFYFGYSAGTKIEDIFLVSQ